MTGCLHLCVTQRPPATARVVRLQACLGRNAAPQCSWLLSKALIQNLVTWHFPAPYGHMYAQQADALYTQLSHILTSPGGVNKPSLEEKPYFC